MAYDTSKLLASQRLRVAYLLALVGGYLDAYTYFERGGVFANAQTGNIVKLSIELADGSGTPQAATTYLVPIVAFVAGLVFVRSVEAVLTRRKSRIVRRLVLSAEMLGLAVVGFIPLADEWNVVANSVVSFVAAMQYEAFSTFHGEAIATTMSTGNLRKMVDNLFASALGHDLDKLRVAAVYASVITCFSAGAFVGARCCNVLESGAVVPAIFVLGIVIVTITVLRRKNVQAGCLEQ